MSVIGLEVGSTAASGASHLQKQSHGKGKGEVRRRQRVSPRQRRDNQLNSCEIRGLGCRWTARQGLLALRQSITSFLRWQRCSSRPVRCRRPRAAPTRRSAHQPSRRKATPSRMNVPNADGNPVPPEVRTNVRLFVSERRTLPEPLRDRSTSDFTLYHSN